MYLIVKKLHFTDFYKKRLILKQMAKATPWSGFLGIGCC